MSAVEYHEGTLAHRTVDAIVVGECGKWEPIAPVGLLIVDEDSEILLFLLIDPLHLSVSLRVEGGRGIGHDVKHAIQFFHELGDEL